MARLGAGRIVWLVAAPFALLTIFAVGALGASHLRLPSETTYRGTLRPEVTPIGIDLPPEAVLDAIVVSEGQLVQAGETLATLDTPEMAAQRARLAADLALAALDRACALYPGSPDFREGLAEWTERQHPGLTEEIVARRAACDAQILAQDAQHSEFTRRIRLAAERDRLLSQALDRALGGDRQTGSTERTDTVISLLLERNTMQQQLGQVIQDRDLWEAQTLSDQADAAQAISRTMSELETRTARLDRLLGLPRVTAPAGGVVFSLRDPGRGYAAASDGSMIEILRTGSQRFELTFDVGAHARDDLADGTPVIVRLAGTGRSAGSMGRPGGGEAGPFDGTIRRNPNPNGRGGGASELWVELSPDARDGLGRASGLGNAGPESSIVIAVAQPDQNIVQAGFDQLVGVVERSWVAGNDVNVRSLWQRPNWRQGEFGTSARGAAAESLSVTPVIVATLPPAAISDLRILESGP